MIKKNTKIIFEGDNGNSQELIGGVPLSKGEIIKFKNASDEIEKFEVVDKIVEIEDKGEDQVAEITYKLRKIKWTKQN